MLAHGLLDDLPRHQVELGVAGRRHAHQVEGARIVDAETLHQDAGGLPDELSGGQRFVQLLLPAGTAEGEGGVGRRTARLRALPRVRWSTRGWSTC